MIDGDKIYLQSVLILLFVSGVFFISVKTIFAAIDFTISNPSIDSDQITINVAIAGLTSQSCQDAKCYLQGVFQKETGANIFGYTQNNSGGWYEYTSNPTIDFIKSTFFYFEPVNASWSGQLKIKNNPGDSGYRGPGDYLMKVNRYSGKSESAAGESNVLTVALVFASPTPRPTNTPSLSPTSTPTPTVTSKPSNTPTPIVTATQAPTRGAAKLPVVSSNQNSEDQNSVSEMVLGIRNALGEDKAQDISTSSSTTSKSGFPILAVSLIGVGASCLIGVVVKMLIKLRSGYNEKDVLP